MQQEFHLWVQCFWLHLLFCISNRASDVTCMWWTRWLLITGSYWNHLLRSIERSESTAQSFALGLLSLDGGAKRCQPGCQVVSSAKRIQVKSESSVLCVLYMASKWAAWETDLKALREYSAQMTSDFSVLVVATWRREKYFFFPHHYQSITVEGEVICILSPVYCAADSLWHCPAGCHDNATIRDLSPPLFLPF